MVLIYILFLFYVIFWYIVVLFLSLYVSFCTKKRWLGLFRIILWCLVVMFSISTCPFILIHVIFVMHCIMLLCFMLLCVCVIIYYIVTYWYVSCLCSFMSFCNVLSIYSCVLFYIILRRLSLYCVVLMLLCYAVLRLLYWFTSFNVFHASLWYIIVIFCVSVYYYVSYVLFLFCFHFIIVMCLLLRCDILRCFVIICVILRHFLM